MASVALLVQIYFSTKRSCLGVNLSISNSSLFINGGVSGMGGKIVTTYDLG